MRGLSGLLETLASATLSAIMKSILTLDSRTYSEVESFEYRPGEKETQFVDTFGSGSSERHVVTRNKTNDLCGFLHDKELIADSTGMVLSDSGFQYSIRVVDGEQRGAKHFCVAIVTRREKLERDTFDYMYVKHITEAGAVETPSVKQPSNPPKQ